MVSVGVHEFRNSLSRYLRLARNGQTVQITRRKVTVAVLERLPGESTVPRQGRGASHKAPASKRRDIGAKG